MEVRELESREREAKLERERIEKQRATEQAVHKHFEESLRLAQQKVSQSSLVHADPRADVGPLLILQAYLPTILIRCLLSISNA